MEVEVVVEVEVEVEVGLPRLGLIKERRLICDPQNKEWNAITKPGEHHVVDVLPVVEGDELEGGEHRPREGVEIGEAEVGIVAQARQANVVGRTRPGYQPYQNVGVIHRNIQKFHSAGRCACCAAGSYQAPVRLPQRRSSSV